MIARTYGYGNQPEKDARLFAAAQDLLTTVEAADQAAQVLYIAAQHVKQSQCAEYLIALTTAMREFGDAWADVQAVIRAAKGGAK